MKKVISILLALTLMLALAIPAFAESIEPTTGDSSQDVTANYTAATDKSSGTVYYVTVAWNPTTSDLAYTAEQAVYTWNGSSMQYEKNTSHDDYVAAAWSGSAGYKVTVTNQSNGSVEVTTEATNTYSLSLTEPENETATVTTAAVDSSNAEIVFTNTTATGTAQTADFTYTYTAVEGADAPTGDADTTITVGTITVTITSGT